MPPAKNEENIFVKGIGIKKVDQIKFRIYFFFNYWPINRMFVEFSSVGYKIGKILPKNHHIPKEIIEF